MSLESASKSQYEVVSSRPLVLSVAADLVEPERIDTDYYRPRFVEAQRQIERSGLSLQALDTIRDLKRIITDGIRQHTKTENGVVLIRTQNLGDPTLELEDSVYVDVKQHEAARKSAVRPGDLLLAIRGYLGRAALVSSDTPEANINQHIARISVNDQQADSGYFWAFFTSPIGTTLLERQVTGTVQQGVMLPLLRQMQVPLPPRPVQEYVGAKVRLAERCRLRARELRLEAQHCLNLGVGIDLSALEQTSSGKRFRTLSVKPEVVLVDTRLVSSRFDSGAYSPLRLALLDALSEAHCEFRPIDLVADDMTAERKRSTRAKSGAVHFVSILHLNDKGVVDLEQAKTHDPVSPGILCTKGDVLFSGINPRQNRVAVFSNAERSLCSAEFAIYRAKPGLSPYYLSFVWRSTYCLNQLEALTRGTSSSRRRLQEEDFAELLVPILSLEDQALIAHHEENSVALDTTASQLVREAKADVEALIEGRLNVDGIVAGRIRPSTWDEIEV